MTDGSGSIKKKSRGIIIVDTCCLIGMCKQPRLTRGKKDFLESLGYLARHGFTVIIPEFVVIEVTNKCPTRELENVLKRVRNTPLNHAENRDKFLNFLEKYKDDIIIVPAKRKDGLGAPLPHFKICEMVREAVEMAQEMTQEGFADAPTHEIPNNYRITPQQYYENRINSNINDAMRAAYQHGDLGEIHCFRVMLDTIVAEIDQKDKMPIYYLSEDTSSNKGFDTEFFIPFKKLSDRCAYPPTVNLVTTAGFFRALGEAKNNQTSILKRVGIVEKPEEILHIMYDEDDPNRCKREWNNPMRDKVGITPDRSPRPFPFNNAIADLRNDLDRAEATKNRTDSTMNRTDRHSNQPWKR